MEDPSKLAPFFVLGDTDPHDPLALSLAPGEADTLALLYEVSRDLTSILDREELLRRIAQHVKRIVNYHVFTVMLWNEATQLLESVFAMHYEDAIPARLRMRLYQGISGTAAAERRPIRIGDVRLDSRYIQFDTNVEVRSELVVPLLLQDRLIGVLDLESTVPQAFTLEHERMLATMGSYIAIALENARLYQQARDNESRLVNDLNTAREIQRQLLPKGAREIPGLDLAAAYAPARELGGDFYDFQPFGEGRLAFALGDVSGKGTAAALYGSLAIGTLRELVTDRGLGAAGMLSVLNRRMFAARLEAKFIAMVFGIYDASGRRLTLANAGEPYPVLIRDGKAAEIQVSGVPLGLFGETDYEEVVIDLLPGDLVVCASDGIMDSEDSTEDTFGAERFYGLLAGMQLHDTALTVAERILAATDEFSGAGNAAYDDRTLVVLRVTDESATDFTKLPIIY